MLRLLSCLSGLPVGIENDAFRCTCQQIVESDRLVIQRLDQGVLDATGGV